MKWYKGLCKWIYGKENLKYSLPVMIFTAICCVISYKLVYRFGKACGRSDAELEYNYKEFANDRIDDEDEEEVNDTKYIDLPR